MFIARPGSELLFDPRGLARQVAQVVQLRATHAATTLDRDLADRRAVGLEHALDALAVRDLAHGERRVQSTVADGDDDAFVRLDALAIAFDDLHLHDHGVARLEVRDLAGHALFLNLLNDIHKFNFLGQRPTFLRGLPATGSPAGRGNPPHFESSLRSLTPGVSAFPASRSG